VTPFRRLSRQGLVAPLISAATAEKIPTSAETRQKWGTLTENVRNE